MKYLITSSLLDGFDWLKSCPKNWKDRARLEFAEMVRREPRPMTEACQRGIDFERLVCANCNDEGEEEFKRIIEGYYSDKGASGFVLEQAVHVANSVANACKGGDQQVRLMRDVVFGGETYHLFGYADIVFPDKIIDIKTTGKYTEGYNYVKRSQHYLYSYCTGINTFEYLVADYNESKFPWRLHRIKFDLSQDENAWVLESRINEVIDYIKSEGLFFDYCDKFTAKHDDNKSYGR